MQLELTFEIVLSILAASAALFLALLFFSNSAKKRKANVFLGLFLLSLSLEILPSMLEEVDSFTGWLPVTSLFTILFIVLYTLATIGIKPAPWLWLLFIPGVLANIGLSEEHEMLGIPISNLIGYTLNLPLLVYLLVIIKKQKIRAKAYFSDVEHKTLSWVDTIVKFFLAFHVLWIVEDVFSLGDVGLAAYFPLISTTLTLAIIYWIGINGFNQKEIFDSANFILTKPVETTKNTPKMESESNSIVEIAHIIKVQKIYADPKLTLRSLAEKLELKEKELSKIINDESGNNFYHFINTFRINDFKNSLNDPISEQLSILGLAENAGFSSKSTFYAFFRQVEGMTPKQYILSLKKSE